MLDLSSFTESHWYTKNGSTAVVFLCYLSLELFVPDLTKSSEIPMDMYGAYHYIYFFLI